MTALWRLGCPANAETPEVGVKATGTRPSYTQIGRRERRRYDAGVSELLAADDATTPERTAETLRAGALAVVPTDSRYAIVADAFQPAATRRVFGAKQRSRHTPLGVVIRSPRQVTGLAEEVPEVAERLMASYWPGPLTVVLRASDGLTWDLGDTAGTVSLRMPVHDLLLSLIAEVGPLACTGANRRGSPVPGQLAAARRELGEEVALYVDGGDLTEELSTVVDVTRGYAEVLRQGAVPADHVRQVATGVVDWGQRPVEEPRVGGVGARPDDPQSARETSP